MTQAASAAGIKKLKARGDSELVLNQVGCRGHLKAPTQCMGWLTSGLLVSACVV